MINKKLLAVFATSFVLAPVVNFSVSADENDEELIPQNADSNFSSEPLELNFHENEEIEVNESFDILNSNEINDVESDSFLLEKGLEETDSIVDINPIKNSSEISEIEITTPLKNNEYLEETEEVINKKSTTQLKSNDNVSVDNIFTIGDGSIENPFCIENVNQFQYIENLSDKNFILGNDIDFKDRNDYKIISSFSGVIDGQGHYLRNLKLNSSLEKIGLFGTLNYNAKISNLNIVDFVFTKDITKSYYPDNYTYIGIICGLNNGTIENVTVKGTVDG